MNENTSTSNEPTTVAPVAASGLTSDEQLVVKIATEYKTPKGAIGWTKAFREHPEWLGQLGTVATAFMTALTLRTRGVLPETPHSLGTRRAKRAVKASATPKTPNRLKNHALAPRNQIVMDMMIKYGDKTGKVDWDDVDSKEPGWDKTLPSRKWVNSAMSYYRIKGVFLKHKALAQGKKLTPSQSGRDLAKVRRNAPAETPPRSLGDEMREEIARKVAEGIQQVMGEIFERCGYCMKCGSNLSPQFMAANLANKHS